VEGVPRHPPAARRPRGGRRLSESPHLRSIVVLGGGTAGLSAALALARDGHRVTLVERDEVVVGEPLEALGWDRKGIPHFMQPHAFTPRGRKEMRTTFPDVFDALLGAGAWDLDLRPKIRGGEPRQDDDELVFLAARRPVIEWALRQAVLREPGVRVIASTRATGLVRSAGDGSNSRPRIEGVETTAGVLAADLVVDAMGRRSPSPGWIAGVGGRPMDERSTDCAIIYYSRYYQVRDGATLPTGPWVPSPRGDLGYAAFSTFPGDNRTFAALIAIPPGDQPLKVLRDTHSFTAAAATMPVLDSWTNADVAEPITEVLAMGSLQNTIRSLPDGRPPVIGLISVADAICHTDPVLSLGLSFSLIHARHLVAGLREHHSDLHDAALAFEALARPEMEERFGYASAIDETRSRLWAGETLDIAHSDGGAYPFFTYATGGAASMVDGDIFRAVIRRNTFLDPLAVLDDDLEMQRRIERVYGELVANGRPRAGPARDDLLDVINVPATRSSVEVGGQALARPDRNGEAVFRRGQRA
jgi:2-polyprenyl-6-methoxyphenol hydroxylase-like FAD-dependent oxidoreductase